MLWNDANKLWQYGPLGMILPLVRKSWRVTCNGLTLYQDWLRQAVASCRSQSFELLGPDKVCCGRDNHWSNYYMQPCRDEEGPIDLRNVSIGRLMSQRQVVLSIKLKILELLKWGQMVQKFHHRKVSKKFETCWISKMRIIQPEIPGEEKSQLKQNFAVTN